MAVDRTRQQVELLLGQPTYFPPAFKRWLTSYLSASDLRLPRTSVDGVASIVNPGIAVAYRGTGAPASGGWLAEDGSVVKRDSYTGLFSVIGTTYNTGGEGVDEFRLPSNAGMIIKT